MKCFLTGLFAIVSLTTALSLTQSAFARPERGWISTTLEGGVANLRDSPSTAADVRATARNGSQHSIVDQQTDSAGYVWYQVQPVSSVTPSGDVWVRSDLMSFVAPIAVQPRRSCDVALSQVESQIRGVANTQIRERRRDDHGYQNGPAGRSELISFTVAGGGAASIMASSVLMNQMAAQLIENCPSVGLVSFADSANLNGYVHYGYMPERMVRPFQCRVGANSDRGLPEWGERNCA
ncbi:MAG: SH3 domain-containing protein [Phormidesmis sp.]